MNLSESTIYNCALPTVISVGKNLSDENAVKEITSRNDLFSALVHDNNEEYRVLLFPSEKGTKWRYECTCSFMLGGACEHVVATMFALLDRQSSPHTPNMIDSETKAHCNEDGKSPSTQMGSNSEAALNVYTDQGVLDKPVKNVFPKPIPRLYLSQQDYDLVISLRYAYYPFENKQRYAEFFSQDTEQCRYIPIESKEILCVKRSLAREKILYQQLMKHSVKQYYRGSFLPDMNKEDWIDEYLPLLSKAGFEIYGHKNIIAYRQTAQKPTLMLSIGAEHLGSFSCTMHAEFQGIPTSLAVLVQAALKERNYVQLSDGTVGEIPDSWLETLRRVFTFVPIPDDENLVVVSSQYLPVLEELYELADEKCADESFFVQLERLKDFSGIKQQEVSKNLICTMRPYQKAGYDWIYFLKSFGFGGCLADDMGLGKTIQALALLERERSLNSQPKTSCVVVPTTLLFNWCHEAQKFAPQLVVACYHGSKRDSIQKHYTLADVILTTYGMILRDQDFFTDCTFNYVILDESQTIKNPDSRISKVVRKLTSKNRLALSGTPIENSLVELWSLFAFLNPGMLGTLHQFHERIVKPIESDQEQSALTFLKKIIFPFVLRRTKQQVAKELPAKTESVVYTEMVTKQRILYDIVREAYLGKIVSTMNTEGVERSGIAVIEGMLRLRQICCHPVLVDDNYEDESGKFLLFDEYIDTILTEGHRVLVFSQFESVLQLLKKRLFTKQIPHELLTGKTQNRQKCVSNFRENNVPVFLISLKAGGVGLNLIEADYVIHMDPWWNPAVENQATDRAHRIGQTKEVFMYKFITANSIEERVMAMQAKKSKLSSALIKQEKSFIKELSKEDILALFS